MSIVNKIARLATFKDDSKDGFYYFMLLICLLVAIVIAPFIILPIAIKSIGYTSKIVNGYKKGEFSDTGIQEIKKTFNDMRRIDMESIKNEIKGISKK
jgi:hypothetical protein